MGWRRTSQSSRGPQSACGQVGGGAVDDPGLNFLVQDSVSHLFSNHDSGGIGVATNYGGHHRSVYDTSRCPSKYATTCDACDRTRLKVGSPSSTPRDRSRRGANSKPATQPAVAKANTAATAKTPPTACAGYSRSPKNRQAMTTLTPGDRAIRAVTTAAEPLR